MLRATCHVCTSAISSFVLLYTKLLLALSALSSVQPYRRCVLICSTRRTGTPHMAASSCSARAVTASTPAPRLPTTILRTLSLGTSTSMSMPTAAAAEIQQQAAAAQGERSARRGASW